MTTEAVELRCKWWTDTKALVLDPELHRCNLPIRQRESGPCVICGREPTMVADQLFYRCTLMSNDPGHGDPGYEHIAGDQGHEATP